ncbi:MAG: c-type cytochrome [Thermoanaerobaculia bacterium]
MRTVLRGLAWILVILVVIAGAGFAWLALRSPEMRPAPSIALHATPEQLARGAYLFNHVSDCVGCHSDHLSDRWAFPPRPGTEGSGGFAFDKGMGVPGVVVAANITPDRETGVGSWSDGEIIRAIREGVTRTGDALFPIMPYEGYRHMSDDDVEAVVAYLRTLAPRRNRIAPRQLDFPVKYMIKFAPKPVTAKVDAPDPNDSVAYGRYLVSIAGCGDCHTPRDEHGKPLPGREFTGGNTMIGPWGRVVTANITPDPSTFVGSATKPQFIARFKAYAHDDPSSIPQVPKGLNTVMPWNAFSGMTEHDLGAIYDYLHTLPPNPTRVVTFPDATHPGT